MAAAEQNFFADGDGGRRPERFSSRYSLRVSATGCWRRRRRSFTFVTRLWLSKTMHIMPAVGSGNGR